MYFQYRLLLKPLLTCDKFGKISLIYREYEIPLFIGEDSWTNPEGWRPEVCMRWWIGGWGGRGLAAWRIFLSQSLQRQQKWAMQSRPTPPPPPHPTPFCQQGKIGKGWGIQSRAACGEKCWQVGYNGCAPLEKKSGTFTGILVKVYWRISHFNK